MLTSFPKRDDEIDGSELKKPTKMFFSHPTSATHTRSVGVATLKHGFIHGSIFGHRSFCSFIDCIRFSPMTNRLKDLFVCPRHSWVPAPLNSLRKLVTCFPPCKCSVAADPLCHGFPLRLLPTLVANRGHLPSQVLHAWYFCLRWRGLWHQCGHILHTWSVWHAK